MANIYLVVAVRKDQLTGSERMRQHAKIVGVGAFRSTIEHAITQHRELAPEDVLLLFAHAGNVDSLNLDDLDLVRGAEPKTDRDN